MTDEYTVKLLMEIHANSAAANVKLDLLTKRLAEHEKDDESAHARIGSLETTRTKFKSYYAVLVLLAPLVGAAATWLWGLIGSAKAL